MLKAIIIDDEINNLKSLEKDLAIYCPQVTIVATCQSGKEGLININKHQPDLIFLDIDMPYIDGFEMLQCLPKINFNIIFVTGHQKYAIEAFRISSVVDYLLKPVKGKQLKEAVQRVEQRATKGISSKELEILLSDVYNGRQIIPLRASNGIDFLKVDEIYFASSAGNYITIYTKDGKTKNSPYCSFTLSNLEEQLPSDVFCRIHQSHLININFTKNYDRHEKYVLMADGTKLSVSGGGKSKLMSQLNFK